MIIETVRQLLGRAIREHRKGGNLTQAQLAERAGISTQTVVLIEGGQRWPEYDNLQRLAAALGVPELALFAWTPAPSPTPQQALEVIARELHRAHERTKPPGDPLAEKLARLGPDARRAIEAMVDGALLQEAPKQDGKAPEKGK